MEDDPVLYVLLRNDMKSFTNGKKMVQVNHVASNLARVLPEHPSSYLRGLYHLWINSAPDGFGTTIVMGYKYIGTTAPLFIEDIVRIVDEVNKNNCFVTGNCPITGNIITDPTYPLKDGKYIHFIPVQTAGWLFGKRKDLYKWTRHLILQD